jgi:hypothetical protein
VKQTPTKNPMIAPYANVSMFLVLNDYAHAVISAVVFEFEHDLAALEVFEVA